MPWADTHYDGELCAVAGGQAWGITSIHSDWLALLAVQDRKPLPSRKTHKNCFEHGAEKAFHGHGTVIVVFFFKKGTSLCRKMQ